MPITMAAAKTKLKISWFTFSCFSEPKRCFINNAASREPRATEEKAINNRRRGGNIVAKVEENKKMISSAFQKIDAHYFGAHLNLFTFARR
jgi:hypothetical protein